MINPVAIWLRDALQNIHDAIKSVTDALNPVLYVLMVLDMLVTMLPEPADLSLFFDTYAIVMEWLQPSFELINYFVNLNAFGIGIGLILITEMAINVFRTWRMIRSFVT